MKEGSLDIILNDVSIRNKLRRMLLIRSLLLSVLSFVVFFMMPWFGVSLPMLLEVFGDVGSPVLFFVLIAGMFCFFFVFDFSRFLVLNDRIKVNISLYFCRLNLDRSDLVETVGFSRHEKALITDMSKIND